jgi:predicted glutamine amidotransferase
MNSIAHGIQQQKGQVHLAVCEPVTEEELIRCNTFSHNEKFKCLAEIIDKKIYRNYKLYKTNYIACDLLQNENTYLSHYSNEDKEAFKQYMSEGLKDIDGNMKELETIFLEMYAAPVSMKK